MTATTPDTAVVLRKMTRVEARQCADEIKLGIETVGKKLRELYEGDGWQALGYSTWRDCVQAEFGYSQSYAYRLLAHEEVNQNLLSFSPIGEKPILPTTEAQARPLAPLAPEQQLTAWGMAIEAAGGQPTAKQVTKAVQQLLTDPPPATAPELEPRREIDPTTATGPEIVADYLAMGFQPQEPLIEANNIVGDCLRQAREALATQPRADIELRIDSIGKLKAMREQARRVNLLATRTTGMLLTLSQMEFIEPFQEEGRATRLEALAVQIDASLDQVDIAMGNERDIILEIKNLFNTTADFKSWWRTTHPASDKKLLNLAIHHPDAPIEKWNDVWLDCLCLWLDAYEQNNNTSQQWMAGFFDNRQPTTHPETAR